MNPCVHKQVYRMNDRPCFPQASVNIFKAIRMARRIMLKEIIHFRPTAGVQEIMLAYIVL